MNATLWTEKEVRILKDMMRAGFSNQEIAKKIGKTRYSVEQKKRREAEKNKSAWSAKEIAMLRDACKTNTAREISRRLGRTPKDVLEKASELRLGIRAGERDQICWSCSTRRANIMLARGRTGRFERCPDGKRCEYKAKQGCLKHMTFWSARTMKRAERRRHAEVVQRVHFLQIAVYQQ